MIIKGAQDISLKQTPFSGRSTRDERLMRGRGLRGSKLQASGPSVLCENGYDSIMCSFFASPREVENGVSKWNYAEKEGENVKNSRRNPLIFREIPRNYGCGRIKFFVRYGKSGHLSFKEGAQFAAIRTSQVVDFWRNLAYSHKK